MSNSDSRLQRCPWLSPKHPKIIFALLAVWVFPWMGCSKQLPSPDRAALIQILGPIDDTVMILGGRSNLSASNSGEPKLTGRLWFVKSMAPLPQRFLEGDSASDRDSDSRKGKSTSISKSTFPARAAYDIAAALKIDKRELELPLDGNIETFQGRLTEWRVGNSQVRIRDFQTRSGWLAVVEAFFDPP